VTKDELFEFDIRGYLVCRQALSLDEVEDLNRTVDDRLGAHTPMVFSLLDMGSTFVELMARLHTLEIIRTMVGDGLRFDHGFGLHMTSDMKINENLHGGPRRHQGSFHYTWEQGHMYNGLIVVMYALTHVHERDGGLILVPGSHRANVNHQPSLDSHLVVNPALGSGDAIIFTEALIHGSRQWRSKHRRRAVVYKYAPGHLAATPYEDVLPYQELATTNLQRELLRPPGAAMRPRVSLPVRPQ
jgi:hypothetical protein